MNKILKIKINTNPDVVNENPIFSAILNNDFKLLSEQLSLQRDNLKNLYINVIHPSKDKPGSTTSSSGYSWRTGTAYLNIVGYAILQNNVQALHEILKYDTDLINKAFVDGHVLRVRGVHKAHTLINILLNMPENEYSNANKENLQKTIAYLIINDMFYFCRLYTNDFFDQSFNVCKTLLTKHSGDEKLVNLIEKAISKLPKTEKINLFLATYYIDKANPNESDDIEQQITKSMYLRIALDYVLKLEEYGDKAKLLKIYLFGPGIEDQKNKLSPRIKYALQSPLVDPNTLKDIINEEKVIIDSKLGKNPQKLKKQKFSNSL